MFQDAINSFTWSAAAPPVPDYAIDFYRAFPLAAQMKKTKASKFVVRSTDHSNQLSRKGHASSGWGRFHWRTGGEVR